MPSTRECLFHASYPPMTSCRLSPSTSAPRTDARGDAACRQPQGEERRATLLEEYDRLMAAIARCSERDDHHEEAELRNRAQVVLARLSTPSSEPAGGDETE